MTTLIDGFWFAVKDGDDRARALYLRHYSAKKNRRPWRQSRQFVGPGQKFVLLNTEGTALFVWLKNTVERYDKQEGVICAVFRNESSVRSSDLIREAMDLAWRKWPGERLFTYVDPGQVQSTNPGYCFQRAGWQKCGVSQRGLVILEAIP